MKTIRIIGIALVLALAASCEKVIEFNGEYGGEKIVMYSNINPAEPSVKVSLYKSKFFLSRDYSSSIYDGLKDAAVTGTVNGTPLAFVKDPSDKDGVFTAPCELKAGDEIAIEASHPTLKNVSARTVVPRKADFTVDKWSYDEETSQMHITLTIHDDPSTTDYYRIAVLRQIKFASGSYESVSEEPIEAYSNDMMFMDMNGLSILSSILGEDVASADTVFEDVMLGSDTRTIDIWIFGMPGSFLSPTSGIKVEVQSYSPELFKYAKSLESASGSDMTGFFNEGVSIFNNIEGGIGCVAAINTSRVDVTETPVLSGTYSYPRPLDEMGPANCYMVQYEGDYYFDATIPGNGVETPGVEYPGPLKPKEAVLLWQDTPNLISSIDLVDGKVLFSITQPRSMGNAVIAVTDGENIIWSWHIWKLDFHMFSREADNGYTLMELNLGATYSTTGPSSYGMLYQWGRKDPFPGSPVGEGDVNTMPCPLYDIDGNPVEILKSSYTSLEQNTLEYATAHPTTVISNYAQYSTNRDWLVESNDALWGCPNPDEPGVKTIYDPCPAGWRLPPADAFKYVTPSGGYEEQVSGFRVGIAFICGWFVMIDEYNDTYSYFPAAGRYDGSYAMLYGSVVGKWGNYWSSAPYGPGLGYSCLAFSDASMSPSAGGSRADAYSVRCVADF